MIFPLFMKLCIGYLLPNDMLIWCSCTS